MQSHFTFRLKDAQRYLCDEITPNLWDVWYDANENEKQQLEDAASKAIEALANIGYIVEQCKVNKALRDAQKKVKDAVGVSCHDANARKLLDY